KGGAGMSVLQIVPGVLLILAGLIFMLLGSIGLVRLPDFFSRTHAASKVDTAGIIMVLLGVAVFSGFTLTTCKVLLGVLFVMLTNPAAVHALARAALHAGLRPWQKGEKPDTPSKD